MKIADRYQLATYNIILKIIDNGIHTCRLQDIIHYKRVITTMYYCYISVGLLN